MNCSLCEKTIDKYDLAFNHLKIDDLHFVDICKECLDKIVKWQQRNYAALFPTKTMKKIVKKL